MGINFEDHIGEEVTIIPRVTFTADRDTEPGAQPWTGILVALTDDGVPLVCQRGYTARPLSPHSCDNVSERNGKLTFGTWGVS